MEEQAYDDLLVDLECPVCTNYMVPPIRQCSTGHSICQSCRSQLPKCPLCQSKFTESKNLTLESLARKMHYPCVNKSLGCSARLTFDNRDEHESGCNYKGFRCAMLGCQWVGKLDEIMKHWDSKKVSSKPYQENNVCHTKLKSDSYYANMIKAHDQLFWFKCKSAHGRIFFVVQHITGSRDNNKFYFEIDIFHPARPKRRLLFSDHCQAIDMEHASLFKDGVAISASLDDVSRYTGDDNLLIYYLRVLSVSSSGESKPESSEHSKPSSYSKPRTPPHKSFYGKAPFSGSHKNKNSKW